jgi:uncharacterized membrane protein
MKRMLKFFRRTLVVGVLFLVPIVVVLVILEKALSLAQRVVAPLAAHLPVRSVLGLNTSAMLAVILLLTFCFIAGLLARTVLAQRMTNWLETTVLCNLPGYEFIKAVGESMLGAQGNETHQVVFVRLEEAWQIGFLIERLDNGLVGVFIPDAPNPRSGAVHFMTDDKVRPAGVPGHVALKCLKRLGVGSNELVGAFDLEGTPEKPTSRLNTFREIKPK